MVPNTRCAGNCQHGRLKYHRTGTWARGLWWKIKLKRHAEVWRTRLSLTMHRSLPRHVVLLLRSSKVAQLTSRPTFVSARYLNYTVNCLSDATRLTKTISLANAHEDAGKAASASSADSKLHVQANNTDEINSSTYSLETDVDYGRNITSSCVEATPAPAKTTAEASLTSSLDKAASMHPAPSSTPSSTSSIPGSSLIASTSSHTSQVPDTGSSTSVCRIPEVPSRGPVHALSIEGLAKHMMTLHTFGWCVTENGSKRRMLEGKLRVRVREIRRTYRFKTFKAAMEFANEVAAIAKRERVSRPF
jgi:hypothetical protein